MNIADKAGLLAGVYRVLKPGGLFTATEYLVGPDGGIIFPVPWAYDASINFLEPADVMREYKRGEYHYHARVANYAVGSNLNLAEDNKSLLADWTILTLTTPVTSDITSLSLAENPSVAEDRIMVGGFSQKYPFKMIADIDCQVRGTVGDWAHRT